MCIGCSRYLVGHDGGRGADVSTPSSALFRCLLAPLPLAWGQSKYIRCKQPAESLRCCRGADRCAPNIRVQWPRVRFRRGRVGPITARGALRCALLAAAAISPPIGRQTSTPKLWSAVQACGGAERRDSLYYYLVATRGRGADVPISVVVPAFNEEHTLSRCLGALVGQPADVVSDIVVVDNNSVDDTVLVAVDFAAQDDRVRVVHQKRPGVAAARQAGFDAASEPIIAGVDADTIVEPGWAAAIAAFFDRHPEVAAVSAPMVMRDLPLQGAYRRVQNRLIERAVQAGARGDTVSLPALTGANMALRATAWAAVRDHVSRRQDLFDDLDLSLCLVDNGSAIALAPGMTATVSGRRTLTSIAEFVRYALCVPRTYWFRGRRSAALLL